MFKDAGLAMLSETEPITYMDDVYKPAKKLTQKDSSGNVVVWGTEFQSWVSYLSSDMANALGATGLTFTRVPSILMMPSASSSSI